MDSSLQSRKLILETGQSGLVFTPGAFRNEAALPKFLACGRLSIAACRSEPVTIDP